MYCNRSFKNWSVDSSLTKIPHYPPERPVLRRTGSRSPLLPRDSLSSIDITLLVRPAESVVIAADLKCRHHNYGISLH
ncbi:unnamed protein product, partial [Dicrocoelium dendriticum]